MQNTKATFTITHDAGEVRSIAINMPFRKWVSEFGELRIALPLICTDTNVLSEEDIPGTIRACLVADCRIAEKLGMGIEKEMHAIGWNTIRRSARVLKMECPVVELSTMLDMAVVPGSELFIPSLKTREITLA